MRVSPPIVLALLAAAFAPGAGARPDLTMRSIPDHPAEGREGMLNAFVDGARWIYYQPPAGWTRGNDRDGGFLMGIPDASQAWARIDCRAAVADGLPARGLIDLCRALLPPGSSVEEATLGAEPMEICGSRGAEVRFRVRLAGRPFLASVLVHGFNDYWLTFATFSAEADFPRVHGEFLRSLCTWNWSDQHDVKPVPVLAVE